VGGGSHEECNYDISEVEPRLGTSSCNRLRMARLSGLSRGGTGARRESMLLPASLGDSGVATYTGIESAPYYLFLGIEALPPCATWLIHMEHERIKCLPNGAWLNHIHPLPFSLYLPLVRLPSLSFASKYASSSAGFRFSRGC